MAPLNPACGFHSKSEARRPLHNVGCSQQKHHADNVSIFVDSSVKYKGILIEISLQPAGNLSRRSLQGKRSDKENKASHFIQSSWPCFEQQLAPYFASIFDPFSARRLSWEKN